MYSDITDLPEDDFDSRDRDIGRAVVPPKPRAAAPGSFIEVCTSCRGTGLYDSGRVTALGHSLCNQCRGAGKLAYKKSKEDREAARDKAKARKERKLDEQLAAFEAEFPLIRDWWAGNDFGFAVSMREAVRKYGALTEKQLAAVDRCVDAGLRRKEEREARAAESRAALAVAPVLNVQPMIDAFERAHRLGVQTPRMKAEGMTFSRAPDHGKNAGAIYVKAPEGTYLGKIVAGRFAKSYDCTPTVAEQVLAVCSDPLTASIAYGKKFGKCSICSRDLSDPESVERGIGPICAEKMFG